MNLEEKIFRAVLDFEAKGDIYEEKEKVILGCMWREVRRGWKRGWKRRNRRIRVR